MRLGWVQSWCRCWKSCAASSNWTIHSIASHCTNKATQLLTCISTIFFHAQFTLLSWRWRQQIALKTSAQCYITWQPRRWNLHSRWCKNIISHTVKFRNWNFLYSYIKVQICLYMKWMYVHRNMLRGKCNGLRQRRKWIWLGTILYIDSVKWNYLMSCQFYFTGKRMINHECALLVCKYVGRDLGVP